MRDGGESFVLFAAVVLGACRSLMSAGSRPFHRGFAAWTTRDAPHRMTCPHRTPVTMTLRLPILVAWVWSAFPAAAAGWEWRPFEPVRRPPVPTAASHPIDAFLLDALAAKGLSYREPASRETLVRRVYLDLIGLAPTPAERAAFLDDPAPDAYPRLVDRLLADPRHAERWARHWMDVWRYSDWAGWSDGKQIRDSQPHIWRWRDWIVDSLAADVGYDRLVVDMLAADERAPEDAAALRATGFLVRNYKMLSREQWLEDTVKHSSLAFMGLTVGCAKCHDHKTDALTQVEYFALRAVFEPHQVRLDPVPGQADPAVDGLARVYDADLAAPTYFFPRGDERSPDKNRPIDPGVPAVLGGSLAVQPVDLPPGAVAPQRRESARRDVEAAAAAAATQATGPGAMVARARLASLRAVLTAERLEDAGKKDTPEWQATARAAQAAQRDEAVTAALAQVVAATLTHAEAALKHPADIAEPSKKLSEARTALAAARAQAALPPTPEYTPRPLPVYPSRSSGRRLALARWLTRPDHPLTARVAVNHVWARHFGSGLAPSLADFGTAARPPSHPALLDWLAAEFMTHGWSFRHLHRLICLSQAYQQSSAETAAPAAGSAASDPASIDPDNRLLWRFQPRRLEAEAVRDNLLHLTGGLDPARGGPEIDQSLALTSGRRSLYLRCAAEKQPEFLQVFDGPSVVECYERKPSVMPQQALALLNSELALTRARAAAAAVPLEHDDITLVRDAFVRFLAREPTADELAACTAFLQDRQAAGVTAARARELLHLALLNHHEFLTLR